MRAFAVDTVPATPQVIDIDTPRPEAGEVLVAVAYSSLNNFDVATAAGYVRQMFEHRFPLVLGRDFAGTVAEVGEGVEGFAVGDAVFGVVMKPFLGAGPLAQYVTVPVAHGVIRIPDGLSAREAGVLGVAGSTALVGIETLDLGQGDSVLVSGATGGVGALAVQLAAARGAKVIATARPGTQADFVTGLTEGVHLVDYSGDLDSQVRAIAPEGVEAVLHLAGDGPALAGLLRKGGRIASPMGLTPDAVQNPDVTVHPFIADPSVQTLTTLATQVAAGTLRVPVTAAYPLEQAPEAFTAFGSGKLGKIAIACS